MSTITTSWERLPALTDLTVFSDIGDICQSWRIFEAMCSILIHTVVSTQLVLMAASRSSNCRAGRTKLFREGSNRGSTDMAAKSQH
jgi:hypothetical protein